MTTRTRLSIGGTVAILVVTAGLVLPALQPPTNCGGNSAALSACNGYILALQLWSADHPGSSFHYGQADSGTRQDLARLPGAFWVRSARLLAKLENVRVDPTADRRVIMVCDRAYDNVPQRTFGKAPMAHAVAYSTGETGLITPEEFGRLDLSGFVDVQTLSNGNLLESAGPADLNVPIRSETNRIGSAAGSRR